MLQQSCSGVRCVNAPIATFRDQRPVRFSMALSNRSFDSLCVVAAPVALVCAASIRFFASMIHDCTFATAFCATTNLTAESLAATSRWANNLDIVATSCLNKPSTTRALAKASSARALAVESLLLSARPSASLPFIAKVNASASSLADSLDWDTASAAALACAVFSATNVCCNV